jgi:hypothetical protein
MAFGQESFSSLADGPIQIVVREGASAILTGVEATGEVGSATVDGDAIVTVTGLEANADVGSVAVIGDANVSPTGLEATGVVGALTVVEGTGVNVLLSSPRLQGSVGVVQPNAQVKIFVVGVAGTGETSGASVVSWNEINPNQDPNWKEIAA